MKKKLELLQKTTDALEKNINELSKGFALKLRDLDDKHKLEKKIMNDEIKKLKETENYVTENVN